MESVSQSCTSERPARPARSFGLLLAGVLGLAPLAGCGNNCESLANLICNCLPNTSEQNACKQQIATASSQRSVTHAEDQYCGKLLQTCTCDALDRGDLVACGYAKPQTPAAQ